MDGAWKCKEVLLTCGTDADSLRPGETREGNRDPPRDGPRFRNLTKSLALDGIRGRIAEACSGGQSHNRKKRTGVHSDGVRSMEGDRANVRFAG